MFQTHNQSICNLTKNAFSIIHEHLEKHFTELVELLHVPLQQLYNFGCESQFNYEIEDEDSCMNNENGHNEKF